MAKHFVEPEELQALLDNELAGKRKAEVERHLAECGECSAIVEELKGVSATLQSWAAEPAPGTLRPPDVPAAETRSRWSIRRHPFMAFAGTVAVLLIIASISIPNLLRSRMSSDGAARRGQERLAAAERAGLVDTQGRLAQNNTFASKQVRPSAPARMIARTASLQLEVEDIDAVRTRVQAIVAETGGFIGDQSLQDWPNQRRGGSFTLHVPAIALDQVLEKLRGLGRVTVESIKAEEVTEQFVDLEARLRNARATERRLIQILNRNTGKLTHILEVEREIARKRGEIERMVSQRDRLLKRVQLATIKLHVSEKFADAEVETPGGVFARMWHSLRDGVLSFLGLIYALVLFLLRWGLHLALFGVIGWQVWRRWIAPSLPV